MLKSLALITTLILTPLTALAQETSPEDQINAAVENGTVAIAAWWTDWCPTCQRQKRVIADLRLANDYPNLTFIEIDHDVWGQDMLAMEQNVTRRSTLVAIGPEGVIDIQVAQTSVSALKGFLDNAQMVATGLPPLEQGEAPVELPVLVGSSQAPAFIFNDPNSCSSC